LETKGVTMRVYLIPVFEIRLKGYDSPQWGAILQRKRMMSAPWAFLEGTASFIGGGMDDGETSLQAILREAKEELGLMLDDEQLSLFAQTENFYFYTLYIGELTQADFQKLAGANTEGALDWGLEVSMSKEVWMAPEFAGLPERAIAHFKELAGCSLSG